jgi:pyrroloquinoline quinone biosynthesis protein B
VHVRILGSAAGGGLPQWNCACENCALVRAGSDRIERRTQDSVAVSSDGMNWFLLNASPDVGRQIESFPELWPTSGRGSNIRGVILTNGDLDHCLGLLVLREWTPIVVYSTERVRRGLLEQNAMFRTLQRFAGQLVWRRLPPFEPVVLEDAFCEISGLSVVARPLAGKLPVHLEGLVDAGAEDNVGLWLEDQLGKRLVYAPGVAHVGGLGNDLSGSDCVLLDGTFWSDDELLRVGLPGRRARDLAHCPIGGEDGTLAKLGTIDVRHALFTHINNTNPILRHDSPERLTVERRGWVVASDGMELSL